MKNKIKIKWWKAKETKPNSKKVRNEKDDVRTATKMKC